MGTFLFDNKKYKSMNKNHCKKKNKYDNITLELNRLETISVKYIDIKSKSKKGGKKKNEKKQGNNINSTSNNDNSVANISRSSSSNAIRRKWNIKEGGRG